MKRIFVVGWYEDSGEQVTIDLARCEVVGVRRNGVVLIRSGERIWVRDDGRIAGSA